MESLAQVAQVTAADAGATMRAAGLRAPLACDTPEDIAEHGECFELRTADGGAGVFVLRRQAGVLWVDGAGARAPGSRLTAAGLALFVEVARQTGCREVAFETTRRGLVRESQKHGYEVAGYIMRKAV